MNDRFYIDINKKHCIRSLAALSGLTYKDIAKYLGIHPVFMCYLMNGQKKIRVDLYKKMMGFLRSSAESSTEALQALDRAYKEFER